MEILYTSAPHLLQRELSKRCESNPKYSLRAFARELGISHANLSMILSGKRRLRPKSASKIAEKLSLPPSEKKFFLEHLEFVKDPAIHEQFDLDKFFMISDWYHYAILSLLEVRGARFEPGWIARRLNITPVEANDAMERLVRLGLVEKQGQRWKQTGTPLRFENKISTHATRKHHKQLLKKAIASLETDPIEVRDFSAITMAVDPKHIPRAIEKIRKFRRSLNNELEQMSPGKRVYTLMVQIFPLSSEDENE